MLCGLLVTEISQIFLVTFLFLGEDRDPPPPLLLQFLVHVDGSLGGRAVHMWANTVIHFFTMYLSNACSLPGIVL